MIKKIIISVAELTSDAHKLQDHVLQEHGIGRKWELHERLRRCLHEVTACLEEMLCLAMIGSEDLRVAAARQELRGQRAGDLLNTL